MFEFKTLKIVEQKFRDIHSFMIRYNKECACKNVWIAITKNNWTEVLSNSFFCSLR